VPRPISRKLGKLNDILVIEPASNYSIELDRGETCSLRRQDSSPNFRERSEAHDLGQTFRIQGVEVYVHPPEPRLLQPRR
jgi:hypothetical protein